MSHTIIALIVFLLPLAYSPGPGNLFFAANGARFGFRATIPASIGYHLATLIVTLGVGFGFATILSRYPQAFDAIQFAGAAYVFWIAVKMMRSGILRDGAAARPAGFGDGLLILLLNPKAYVIMLLMFTQFLHPDQSGQLWAIAVIATVFTLNNLLAFTLWTLLGDVMAAGFRSPDKARMLNVFFGVLLAGVALWMLLR